MLDYTLKRDARTGEEVVEVPFTGHLLLDSPMFNKGSAFTEEERRAFGLLGLLPPHVSSLELQTLRVYEGYHRKDTDLERHIFLRALQDRNETLCYRLMLDHIGEMMPIVYTPTVGAACQEFSHIYRRPRGLFVAYPERGALDVMLANAPFGNVEVIVVTDGERILGLGDQGAGGMGIPIGKLSLYTLCGGIHPTTTLPIMLDVGTNNEDRLHDPLYVGWCHERIRGQDYDDFIEAFIQAVGRRFPNVLLQWEDFAQANAARLLERYRDRLCTFNDDIQGTAAVATGTLLAAVQAAGARLRDQRVAIFGAGSAGCGISAQVSEAMVQEGLTPTEARGRFWLIDRQGLLRDGMNGLLPSQIKFVQPRDRCAGWPLERPDRIGLADVVRNAKPSVLIGVSGQPSVFTEEIVRALARNVERPIIFSLSNPTSRSEARPDDLIAWTEGRALIATGSPFADVRFQGRTIPIAQCNNSYVFPGLGLGILAVKARRVTDAMFMAAARALAECSPARSDPQAELLPPLKDIRKLSRRIALAVAEQAQYEGVADPTSLEELERCIDAKIWTPRYPRLLMMNDE